MKPRPHESGQIAVETALTVPLMLFFILGVLQLGLMHQAQLMTEYAAYRAVRAGIVNDGDCERMESAALISLLPTMGKRVDTFANAWFEFKRIKAKSHLSRAQELMTQAGLKQIRVEVVHPKRSQLDGLFQRYGGHLDKKEIDFDDVRDDQVRIANILTVRVRYMFELRIPFANAMIHSWFMGAEALKSLRGIQFEAQQSLGGTSAFTALEAYGATRGGEYARMALVAQSGKFLVPLQANYTMRMQSNLFTAVKNCAVDN